MQPRVWGLLGRRWGDNQQVAALCAALGWPYELKQLRITRESRVPNVFRGARTSDIEADPSTPLAPPWPDLVIAVGRRSVPIALSLRAASAGRCRLVYLGRPLAPRAWFDLIVTTPQYRVPAGPNVIENPLPFGHAVPAPEQGVAELNLLARPRLAVLVGGPTRELEFGAAQARDLAALVNGLVAREGGSVLVTTSPRTPEAVTVALREGLQREIHAWRAGAPNPYPAYLAAADRFVVTGDSVSMLADACRTGAPVRVFPLPPRFHWRRTAISALYGKAVALADRLGPFSRPLQALLDTNLVVPYRTYADVHRALEQHGLLGEDGGAPARDAAQRRAAIEAWDRATVARVKSLVIANS